MHVWQRSATEFQPEEIMEVFMHASVYCGLPAANHAFKNSNTGSKGIRETLEPINGALGGSEAKGASYQFYKTNTRYQNFKPWSELSLVRSRLSPRRS